MYAHTHTRISETSNLHSRSWDFVFILQPPQNTSQFPFLKKGIPLNMYGETWNIY